MIMMIIDFTALVTVVDGEYCSNVLFGLFVYFSTYLICYLLSVDTGVLAKGPMEQYSSTE